MSAEDNQHHLCPSALSPKEYDKRLDSVSDLLLNLAEAENDLQWWDSRTLPVSEIVELLGFRRCLIVFLEDPEEE